LFLVFFPNNAVPKKNQFCYSAKFVFIQRHSSIFKLQVPAVSSEYFLAAQMTFLLIRFNFPNERRGLLKSLPIFIYCIPHKLSR
jgi:hypothetical protein